MKLKNLFLTGLAICAVALSVYAALPTYKTTSATGTAAAPSLAKFTADPNSQIRVVNVNCQSDTNNARLEFTTGNGAYYQTATNVASSSVTNQINSTNGLVPNSVVVLQHQGALYVSTISSFDQNATNGNGTNVVLASGGWGVASTVGDDIFQMSSTNYLFIGAATNGVNGDAIFVGNYGRPVLIRLTPALVTNAIPLVSAHYDSQGQN